MYPNTYISIMYLLLPFISTNNPLGPSTIFILNIPFLILTLTSIHGLPSMGLHRVGHDWTDLALALGVHFMRFSLIKKQNQTHIESEGKKSWFGRLFKKGLIFLKKDLTPNLFFMSFLFDLTGFISWCPCQDSLPKLVRKAYLKKS